ncbi:MAG: cupin domain-containing protein [Saprospiraceae bacterium]
MIPKKVNLADKFAGFSEHWTPKIVGKLNQQLVKIAKVKGEFAKHHHEVEDELFFVVEGTLFLELETETIELNAGEMVVIPRGVAHRPYAPEEAKIMLFEPETTLNTGNERNGQTQEQLEEL